MSARTLVLMRHAKSSWEVETTDDLRPLSARGRRDATAAGAWLVERGISPDLVLCSPALRAQETWDHLSAAGVRAGQVRSEDWIYEGFAGGLEAEFRRLASSVRTALVIGHAPVLEDVIRQLASRSDSAAWRLLDEKFPTSAIAVLKFDGEWPDLAPGAAELADYAVPRG